MVAPLGNLTKFVFDRIMIFEPDNFEPSVTADPTQKKAWGLLHRRAPCLLGVSFLRDGAVDGDGSTVHS